MNDIANIPLPLKLYEPTDPDDNNDTLLVLEQLLAVIDVLADDDAIWPDAIEDVLIEAPELLGHVPVAIGLSFCENHRLKALCRVNAAFGELLDNDPDDVISQCFQPIEPVLRAWWTDLGDADWTYIRFPPEFPCATVGEIRAWILSLPWDQILFQAARRDMAARELIAGCARAVDEECAIVALAQSEVAHVR